MEAGEHSTLFELNERLAGCAELCFMCCVVCGVCCMVSVVLCVVWCMLSRAHVFVSVCPCAPSVWVLRRCCLHAPRMLCLVPRVTLYVYICIVCVCVMSMCMYQSLCMHVIVSFSSRAAHTKNLPT